MKSLLKFIVLNIALSKSLYSMHEEVHNPAGQMIGKVEERRERCEGVTTLIYPVWDASNTYLGQVTYTCFLKTLLKEENIIYKNHPALPVLLNYVQKKANKWKNISD
jgi:hypothetical protein